MKSSFLKRLPLLALAAGLVLNAACSGSATSTSTGSTGGSTTTGTVAGTSGLLKTADGSPVAGAAVAISTSASSSLSLAANSLKNSHGHYIPLPQLTDSDGTTCDDLSITGTTLASDCTGADGAYTLVADDIPCGSEVTFSAKKGSFFISFSITLNCSEADSDGDGETIDETVALDDFEFSEDCGFDDDTDDSTDDTTDDTADDSDVETLVKTHAAYTTDESSCSFDIASMAVVTGYYDDIQNVLAKLGYGEVTDGGELDMDQDFDFDLIDGTVELDDETYTNFEDLVSDSEALNQYDIIFINCGNSAETLSTDPDVMANLQEYVDNGGKLYVTDWSYMFIEQNFSDFMNFVGGGDDPETGETPITAAKVGTGGITSDATVENDTMAEWLDNVTVNEGDIEEDCYSLADESVDAQEGARNEDGTVTIGDFLSAWVVMEGLHDGIEDEPTIWLSGPVTYSDPDTFASTETDAPLSVTRAQGEGEILYSSYHTAHSCPTQGFWPQERVLQYLVFEL
jgi:hypothetical protein